MKRKEYFNEIFLFRFVNQSDEEVEDENKKRKISYRWSSLNFVYDHLILLLNFPACYSSIIQELNVCFTIYMKRKQLNKSSLLNHSSFFSLEFLFIGYLLLFRITKQKQVAIDDIVALDETYKATFYYYRWIN